jgi:radical SAM superfamily enzyme
MISSRGCLYKCTFCTNSALRKHHIHYHSIDRVIAEIKCISKIIKSTQRVVFYDDAFTLNLPRAKKICKRIIEEQLHTIHFICATRIDQFDEELLNLLAHAGFKSIYFGLETATPKILHHIKKVRSTPAINDDYGPELNFLETMKKNINSTKAKGLMPVVSIILGLPGETDADARNTLAFVDQLEINTYMHNFFKVIYGTENYNNCSMYGIGKKCHPFPLLYVTDYAFDVYAIPPLKNSVVHRLIDTRNKVYIQRLLTFFGVRGKVHTAKIDFDTIHILLDVTKDLDKVFSWLANIIQLSSDLYIVEPNWRFSSLESILHSFVENKVPVFSYRRLHKKIDGSDSSITYCLKNLRGAFVDDEKYSLKGISDYCSHILPFNSEVMHSLYLKNETVLKTIDSMADLKQLLRQVDGTEIGLSHTDLIAYNYEIVDKCRWAAKQCDVCYLRKLIIANNHEVFACYTGQVIGVVGDDYSTLSERIMKKKFDALERRGCHACSVSKHCPQCLFLPTYMSEGDYCQTMKASAKIRIAIALPSLVHELFLQQSSKMERTTCVNIAWLDERILAGNIFKNSSLAISPWQLLKIELSEGCYLFCIEKSRFTPLDPHLSKLWDLLSSAAGDWDDLKRLASCRTAYHADELTKQINLLFEHLQRAIGPNLKTKLHFLLEK